MSDYLFYFIHFSNMHLVLHTQKKMTQKLDLNKILYPLQSIWEMIKIKHVSLIYRFATNIPPHMILSWNSLHKEIPTCGAPCRWIFWKAKDGNIIFKMPKSLIENDFIYVSFYMHHI